MSTIVNRTKRLLESGASAEVREACSSLLQYAGQMPDASFGNILIEKLSTIDDPAATEFVENEKRLRGLDDMGLGEMARTISASDLGKANPQLRMRLMGLCEAAAQAPDFTLLEHFTSLLSNYAWDPAVSESLASIERFKQERAEDILVAQAIRLIRSQKGAELYEDVCATLEAYLEDKTVSNRAAAMQVMERFRFNHAILDLSNKMKMMEAATTGSFAVVSRNNSCEVMPIYSFVVAEDAGDIFAHDGRYFRLAESGVEEVSSAGLPTEFVAMSEYIAQPHVGVSERGVTAFLGRDRVDIVKEGDTPVFKLNGAPVSADALSERYVRAGVFSAGFTRDILMLRKLQENFEGIMSMDFGKAIYSKTNRGASVSLFNFNGNISAIRRNPAMNDNMFFPSLTGGQAHRLVLETLNYDISESLAQFLEGEARELAEAEAEARAMLTVVGQWEARSKRINEALSSPEFVKSEELAEAAEHVARGLEMARAEYGRLMSIAAAIRESSTETIGFKVGDTVKDNDGNLARVTSMASSAKTADIITDDGDTETVPLEDIKPMEKAIADTIDANESTVEEIVHATVRESNRRVAEIMGMTEDELNEMMLEAATRQDECEDDDKDEDDVKEGDEEVDEAEGADGKKN